MLGCAGQDGALKRGANQDGVPAPRHGILSRGTGRDGAFEDKVRLERSCLYFERNISI